MTLGTMRIQRIEITDRRIRGSNEIAYLTATYKATFSSAEGSPPEQVLGSHLWILRKQSADRVEPLRGSDSGIRRSIAVQLLVCLQVVTVIMPDVEQFSPGSLQKVAGNRQLGRSFSALGEHEFNVAALNRHVKAWRVALAQLGAECI